MKRNVVKLFLSLVMVLSIVLSGCGSTPTPSTPSSAAPSSSSEPSESTVPSESPAAEPANVAVVFSTLGDSNFNDWGFEGIKMAAEQLGITYDYVECPTVSEAETQIDMLASSEEYDLIIVLGSDRKDALENNAHNYPDQKFTMIDSSVTEGIDNLSGIRANFPEWGFLSGVLAGIMTQDDRFEFANKDNVIGFAGGADSPVSRAGATGFLAGAKYVNPSVELIYTIVGSYTNPGKAKEIAMTTYGRGADIMSANAGSSGRGVLTAAEELGKYFISTSYGMNNPKHSPATSITRFDLFVLEACKAVVENRFKGENYIFGIKDGMCDISFEVSGVEIPEDVKAVIEDVRKEILDGKLTFPNDPDEVEEWSKNNQYDWNK